MRQCGIIRSALIGKDDCRRDDSLTNQHPFYLLNQQLQSSVYPSDQIKSDQSTLHKTLTDVLLPAHHTHIYTHTQTRYLWSDLLYNKSCFVVGMLFAISSQ